MFKKFLSLVLLGAMLLQLVPTVVAKTDAEATKASFPISAPPNMKLTSRTDYTITEGVTESHLLYNDDSGENQIAGFMTIIEADAEVTFKASYKGYYSKGSTAESRAKACKDLPWGLQRPTEQAAAYEAATGDKVLFATNADFYNVSTYQPIGHLIMEGNVLQTFGMSRKQPYFAVLKDGSFAIRDFSVPYTDVLEAVSGCWLIMDGKNVTDTYYHSEGYKSNNPMNAIGMTADGRIITFVADGRQAPYSVGINVHNLAEFFLSMGCVNAIDLDGGGSATYASVHQGETKLVVRNSPSDGSERAIANALLLVSTAGDCAHDYSKNYVMQDNGTHDVSCAACGKTINVGHSYTQGICPCGDRELQDDYLYFDFGNTAADQKRYCQAAYGYWNFDASAGAQWSNVPWNGTYLSWQKNEAVQIDHASGTLIASKSPDNPHSYFYVTSIPNLYYKPKRADYLQIRLSLSGFDAATAKSRLCLNYYKDGSTVQYTDAAVYSFGEGTVFDGSYMTLTLPLAEAFRNSETISGIKLNFWNLEGLGTATFDYVYIGSRENLPSQRQLYFDFADTEADQRRYARKTYGGQNFDEASAWYATRLGGALRDEILIDHNEGIVQLTKTADNAYSYFYLMTDEDLAFQPENSEFLQVKLKLSGFDAAGKSSRLSLHYYKDGDTTQYMDAAVYSFGEGTVFDDSYMTLTLPITDDFRNSGSICDIKLNFWNLSGTGTVVFDYIYIGPEDTLPSQEQLSFGFENTAADRTRYSTKTYSAENFDEAASWCGTWLTGKVRDSVEVDHTEGTLTLTKSPDNAYSYFYLMTNKNLHFDPKHTQVLQVRMKLSGFDAAGANTRFTLNYYKDGDTAQYMDGAVYSFGKGTIFDGSYMILTLPLTEEFRNGGILRSIKLNFWNLEGTGTVVFDYVYIGGESNVPTPYYTVVFQNEDGSVLSTQRVYRGEAASYTAATPTKDCDSTYHYTFKGWDKELDNITADTVITAQFTSAAHSYTYEMLDLDKHQALCACGYSKTEAHSYTDGICLCGDTEITVDESIEIYHTLDLASDISITFAVPASALSAYDSYYLECILPEYEGNTQVGTSTVEIQPVLNGNYYYFTLTGITAVRMGDMVEAVLHMTKGTRTYLSKKDSYSVATYAYGMLNSSNDAKMLTLCADLLRYGAEAQSFKGYRTDALVDAAMTDAQRAYLSDTNALTFTATDSYLGDLASPTITWVGKTLDLGSKVGMKFVFNAKNYSGNISNLSMKVSYTGSNGETKTVTLTGTEVYNAANSYYSFTFYGLLASELRTIVDVAIFEGNTQLSESLRYSAETYASKTGGTNLEALTRALFAYSDSAKTFFAK